VSLADPALLLLQRSLQQLQYTEKELLNRSLSLVNANRTKLVLQLNLFSRAAVPKSVTLF
jgi:hypothetical protein